MKYNFDEIIDRKNNYSAKYDELKAKFGTDDLIPMWVADMDFKTAQPIIDALIKRAEQGIYGYTSRPASYYEAASEWFRIRHGFDVKPEWIIHSPGIVPALSLIIKEYTSAEDKIIIQPPVYYPFFDVVTSHGRKLLLNPLKKLGENYVMDYENLEEVAKQGAKMLILCNPHNPVGRVWNREELTRLGEICLKYNIKVISDEIHCDIVFKENKYTPFASISEEFCNNSITCVSPSKTFNLAGLQMSMIICPDKADLIKFDKILGMLDIKRNNSFSVVAAEAGFRYGSEWVDQVVEYIEENIDFVNKFCKENIPKIKPNKPQGTYLVWIDCRELGMDNKQLSKFMLDKVKVALDDGYWFGTEGEGHVRMNVACPRTIVKEALERLKKAFDSLGDI